MIYLDNAATTKVNSDIFDLYKYYNEKMYFNPSALYSEGVKLTNDINNARELIANKIGANANEILFTSGGSESDNLAIYGSVKNNGKKILTSIGEHSAVYNCFFDLKNKGYNVEFVNVKKNGAVDLDDLRDKITEDTQFVSFMHVNNETGAINDLTQIVEIVKSVSPKCLIHSDGVQAFCKMPVNVKNLQVDMYSISGHKIHAPKGVGALFIKDGVKISPLIHGGGQENGLRSGTENVFGIVAFAKAVESINVDNNLKLFLQLKSQFLEALQSTLSDIIVNSDDKCVPSIVNISINNIKSEVLQHMLESDRIIIGLGSACSKKKASRLLAAMKIRQSFAEGTIRISFCGTQSSSEVIYSANKIAEYALSLRKLIRR